MAALASFHRLGSRRADEGIRAPRCQHVRPQMGASCAEQISTGGMGRLETEPSPERRGSCIIVGGRVASKSQSDHHAWIREPGQAFWTSRSESGAADGVKDEIVDGLPEQQFLGLVDDDERARMCSTRCLLKAPSRSR